MRMAPPKGEKDERRERELGQTSSLRDGYHVEVTPRATDA
jgi:hypothetical protein